MAAAGGIAWWTYLFPVLGSGGAMLFALVNPQPIYLVASGLFVVGSVAMGVGMYFQQRSGQRRRLRHDREAYLAHVDQVRSTARETARQQRASALWRHPAPQRLWSARWLPPIWRPGGSTSGSRISARAGCGSASAWR